MIFFIKKLEELKYYFNIILILLKSIFLYY